MNANISNILVFLFYGKTHFSSTRSKLKIITVSFRHVNEAAKLITYFQRVYLSNKQPAIFKQTTTLARNHSVIIGVSTGGRTCRAHNTGTVIFLERRKT